MGIKIGPHGHITDDAYRRLISLQMGSDILRDLTVTMASKNFHESLTHSLEDSPDGDTIEKAEAGAVINHFCRGGHLWVTRFDGYLDKFETIVEENSQHCFHGDAPIDINERRILQKKYDQFFAEQPKQKKRFNLPKVTLSPGQEQYSVWEKISLGLTVVGFIAVILYIVYKVA